MTNLIINSKNNTIEMSKKFANAASRYGTEEYKALQEVRRDYPNYRLITKSSSKSPVKFHGLTYDFMEKYIKTHDDENGSIMAAFNNLRATSEEAQAIGAEAAFYGEIKAWFIKQYPAFEAFQKMRDELLEKVAA